MNTPPLLSAGLVLFRCFSFSPWDYQLDNCLMPVISITASWEDPLCISCRAKSRPDGCINREIDRSPGYLLYPWYNHITIIRTSSHREWEWELEWA